MKEREELIERVTAEVMKIYNVSPATSPANPVKGNRAAAALTPTQNTDVRSALILVCGNSKQAADTVEQFKSLRSSYRQIRVLLSDNAKAVFSQKSRPFAGFEYVFDEGGLDGLAGFDDVYLLNPTLNTLSKMAALQADNVIARVARQCLVWGKSVRIMLVDVPALPSGMMDEFNTIMQKLVKYGYGFSGDLSVCDRPAAKSPTVAPAAASAIPKGNISMVREKFAVPDSNSALAAMIDHTLLKAEATKSEVEALCNDALAHNFASVCVNPGWVQFCAEKLKGSPVQVCTVIGFPLGATTSETKAFETQDAVAKGATEIDMVINIGALKNRDYDFVRRDIEAVVKAASSHLVKVIFETALLTREEIIIACKLSKDAGAHFVKTSTGFSKGGATAEHIRLMRNAVGSDMGVKASGGVRDLATAKAMIEAGANRIGASSSVDIVTGKAAKGSGY